MRDEFIGKYAKIVEARNESLNLIEGKIIDETKNTFTIRKKGGKEVKLLKEEITLEIEINGKKVRIEGRILMKRPYERVKVR